MNVLIIGNGFDIAHGLETSYPNILDFFDMVQSSFVTYNKNSLYRMNKLQNYKASKFVKKYVETFFSSAKTDDNKEIVNSNLLIQEMHQELTDNIWYTYLNELYKEKKIRGINWIDFEREISGIIETIDREQENLYMPFEVNRSFEDEKMNIFISQLRSIIYQDTTNLNISTYAGFLNKTYDDLNRLIRCIEIYLEECIDKQEVCLYSQDMVQIQVDKVLCFNYTHTYENIYSNDKKEMIHYLHGEAKGNGEVPSNMVLGIDEYYKGQDKDIHTNYNIYKKFTQRIIKETGFQYRDWLVQMDGDGMAWSNWNKFVQYGEKLPNNVYIFGHSLDITDKDVIKEFIDRDDAKITVFYHNKQQQTQQIANLVKILGQEKFISMINQVPQRICFVLQQEMIKNVNKDKNME